MPPVAVFRKYGCGKEALICTALTCAGYFPGLIYAKIVLDDQAEKQPLMMKGKNFETATFESMMTGEPIKPRKPDIEAPLSEVVVKETPVPDIVVAETAVPETAVPEPVLVETAMPETPVPMIAAAGTAVPEAVASAQVLNLTQSMQPAEEAATATTPVVTNRSPLPASPRKCEALLQKAADRASPPAPILGSTLAEVRAAEAKSVVSGVADSPRQASKPRQRSTSMKHRLAEMQSRLEDKAPEVAKLSGDASTSAYQTTCGLCHGTGKIRAGLACACVEAEDPTVPDGKVTQEQIDNKFDMAKAKTSEAESLVWLSAVSKGGEEEEKTKLAAEAATMEAAALTAEAERLKVIAKKQSKAAPLVSNLPTGLSAEQMLGVMRDRWAKLGQSEQ